MILCLESSAEPTVVGIVREVTVSAGRAQPGIEPATERVFQNRDGFADEIEAMFREAGIIPREITRIAIGIGPGSFTGLRVSLSYAKGFARGVSIPILPVSSLKVVAANARGKVQTIVVVSYARRGELHVGVFDGRTLIERQPTSVQSFSTLADSLPSGVLLIGPGIAKLPPELRDRWRDCIPDSPDVHRPHAHVLAELAATEWTHRVPPSISNLVPVYGLDFPAPSSGAK